MVIPKKNRKWRIFVDYRETNKATQKDHFPLPFIDQVLDTLARKKFFSFLDDFSRYNQIQIALQDQDKTSLPTDGVHSHIGFYPLDREILLKCSKHKY